MHVRKSTAAGVVFGTQLNYEPRSRPRVTKRKMIDPLNVSSVYELILRLLYVLVPEQARWSKKQNQIIYKLNTRAHTGRFDSKFSHIFKTNTKFGLLY